MNDKLPKKGLTDKERLYQIGRFIAEFSQLEYTLKIMLVKALSIPNDMGEIITSPYNFSNLCEIVNLIYLKKMNGNKEGESMLKRIVAACEEHRKVRNKIAHATWTPSARTLNKKKQPVYHFINPEELIEKTSKVMRTTTEVLRLLPYANYK